jgi:hypothetical protein
MAYVDLDKIINVSGWGGFVYPSGDDPAPYPVLTQSIGILNKPDAWDWDSNGWFGLLNNTNNSINAQNYNWNTQMALASVHWTWPLSTRVKSFDFSQNVGQIDSGVIKYSFFKNNKWTLLSIDNLNKDIVTLWCDVPIFNPWYLWALVAKWTSQKITSWGNTFVVSQWRVYNIDAGDKITSYTWYNMGIDGTSFKWNRYVEHFASKWWYVRTLYSWQNSSWSHSFWQRLDLINSDGSITNIHNNAFRNTDYSVTVANWYQQDDNVAYISMYMDSWWSVLRRVASVDITDTTTFSQTEILLDHSVWYPLIFWEYDWWNLCVIWTNVYKVDWSWYTLIWPAITWIPMLWNTLLQLQDIEENISILSNTVNIFWEEWGVWSIQTSFNTLFEWVDFIWLLTDNLVFGRDDGLYLKINWVIVSEYKNKVLNQINIVSEDITQYNIWDKYIEIEIVTPNIWWQDLKLALWATGGTYATPTLPNNNGMSSGNATTPWVPWSNASYINLTLST